MRVSPRRRPQSGLDGKAQGRLIRKRDLFAVRNPAPSIRMRWRERLRRRQPKAKGGYAQTAGGLGPAIACGNIKVPDWRDEILFSVPEMTAGG